MHDKDKGFPTNSTYKAPITVVDEDGNSVDLTSADITYKITEDRAGRKEHYTATDADSAITIESNNSNVVIIEIPATDVDWVGEVYEQLRVDLGEPNAIVLHRLVYFYDVSIEP